MTMVDGNTCLGDRFVDRWRAKLNGLHGYALSDGGGLAACRPRGFTAIIPACFLKRCRSLASSPAPPVLMAGHTQWASIQLRRATRAKGRKQVPLQPAASPLHPR